MLPPHSQRKGRRAATASAAGTDTGQDNSTSPAQSKKQQKERLRILLTTPVTYMSHPDFERALMLRDETHDTIMGPMPSPAGGKKPRRQKAPKDIPPYLASLYTEAALLDREQEAHLFRKMNYLKFQAEQLRQKLLEKHESGKKVKSLEVDALEALKACAAEEKDRLVKANLRLVVSIAKKWAGPGRNLFELISDGNLSLMNAAEKFDISRGNKFSTYASWAVIKNFTRTVQDDNRIRDRERQADDGIFQERGDHRTGSEAADERRSEAQAEYLKRMIRQLDHREQRIIAGRYGLGGTAKKTLEELGEELKITKERVRQIQSRAEKKLKQFAKQDREGEDLMLRPAQP